MCMIETQSKQSLQESPNGPATNCHTLTYLTLVLGDSAMFLLVLLALACVEGSEKEVAPRDAQTRLRVN